MKGRPAPMGSAANGTCGIEGHIAGEANGKDGDLRLEFLTVYLR
jgi:hypothetical protein